MDPIVFSSIMVSLIVFLMVRCHWPPLLPNRLLGQSKFSSESFLLRLASK